MTRKAMIAAWRATRRAMRMTACELQWVRDDHWKGLRPALLSTPALSSFNLEKIKDLPVTSIAEMRQDYGLWNSLGVTHDNILKAAQDAEQGGKGMVIPGVIAGFSTGSSGERGVFMASADERANYIGQILARLMPLPELVRPQRIALVLRANSELYEDVRGWHFKFKYFSLGGETEKLFKRIKAFNPTVLIAPSHCLKRLALEVKDGFKKLRHIFYGAEPMGHEENRFISSRLGQKPKPIYQATEGFLGAACRYGTLHLNEHSLDITLEPVPGTNGFRPVITDLQRYSQPIVRVRGDDFIELNSCHCQCGYAGRAIRPVMGRISDLIYDGEKTIVPREIYRAAETTFQAKYDWCLDAKPERLRFLTDQKYSKKEQGIMSANLKQLLDTSIPVEIAITELEPPYPKRQQIQANEFVIPSGHE